MSRAKIKRTVGIFEQPWFWLGVAFVGALALAAMVGAAAAGAFGDADPYWFPRSIRGHTFVGIFLGLFSIALVGVAFAYAWRKRAVRFPAMRGTMMGWLWVHVYVGLLALLAATLHGGFGLLSPVLTTGKIVYFLFFFVAISGVAWRIAYSFVPPAAQPQIGNYSKAGAEKRAEEQTTEIEKIAAGRSPGFHQAKNWLLEADRPAHEVQRRAAALSPEEHGPFAEVVRLAAARSRAIARKALQDRFTEKLQGWRKWHVPLSFAVLVALLVHVCGAFDLQTKVLPASLVSSGVFAPFQPSETCKDCHKAIYDSWAGSMHAHALTSPVTIVQNNQDIRTSLKGQPSPDPRRVCINCHAPTSASTSIADALPLPNGDLQNEGISCVACHQFAADSTPGGGGLAAVFQKGLEKGRVYYGNLSSPVGNAFHKSDRSEVYRDSSQLCANCHDVNLDRNGDGKIVKGEDLVLQTTFDEWRAYQKQGGTSTCVSCHMPPLPTSRAADNASIPFEQDTEAPRRQVHDHSFVGVDYPLDTVAKRDPQRKGREDLLRSAAKLAFETPPTKEFGAKGAQLAFKVSLENESGHALPTGFAFARQMWLEVVVRDGRGNEVFSSGRLAKPTDDLCDAGTFGDATNPLKKYVEGCAQVDAQLVNFQQKLMTAIQVAKNAAGEKVQADFGFKLETASGGTETFLQHIEGGAVARVRPSDGAELPPIKPFGKRALGYVVPLGRDPGGTGTVTVRLLFRNLPPYWLRGMADGQEGDPFKLGPMIANVQTLEMGTIKATF